MFLCNVGIQSQDCTLSQQRAVTSVRTWELVLWLIFCSNFWPCGSSDRHFFGRWAKNIAQKNVLHLENV